MDTTAVGKEKYFIVTRGKTWKGFSRGAIGRVEEEAPDGVLTGRFYSGGGTSVGPSSGGVKKEDTHPLTRHQAQLLLNVYVNKRMDLVGDSQLFSAVSKLAQHDIVVVKYKRRQLPALVKNLMKIERRENMEELPMLGFEVEFLDGDHSAGNKKPSPLPLFSAADILQVVPAATVPYRHHWTEGNAGGVSRKAVSRGNSLPNMGPRARPGETRADQRADQRITPSHSPTPAVVPLDVGSLVEVKANTGVTVYGTVRWKGVPQGKTGEWAGLELEYDVRNCSDGVHKGQRYFTCQTGRALFVPVAMCSPDQRFLSSLRSSKTHRAPELPPDIALHDSEGDAPPIAAPQAASLLVGRMRGIQGHFNSCYLDAALFSLFCSSDVLDGSLQRPECKEDATCQILRKTIVNRLRRNGFVPAESVMSLRKQLGCHTFLTEEKDPEEFISILLQQVLRTTPLLKLRSGVAAPDPAFPHRATVGTSQEAYTFQIILEKEQVARVPTVQQLMDASFLSLDLKFEEAPSCLIMQMPRFGKGYKMFPLIIPSTQLDLTDLLHDAPRACFVCGQLATTECFQCLQDPKLQPGTIKQYCSTCSTQVHVHPLRQTHRPRALAAPAGSAPPGPPFPRVTMELFAVLCIHTSHYVSFVKHGPEPRSWLFFDSMADRCGDDQSGYNVPEVTACPQLGDFLSRPEEEMAAAHAPLLAEPVRRLLCDSYMFLYQRTPPPPPPPAPEEDRRCPEGGGPVATFCTQNNATALAS